MKTRDFALFALLIAFTFSPVLEAQSRKVMGLTDRISVDFQANTLEDVYTHLTTVTGMDFIVNWKALEAEGITKETPITFKLNNVKFQTVLVKIMQVCEADGARMGTLVEKTYIEVSTRAQLSRKKVTRVYSIATLIMKIPDYNKPPQFDLEGALGQAKESSTGGSIFGPADEEDTKSEAELAEEVADLIRSLVSPEIWEKNGGSEGVIKIHGKNLIVSAPRNIQREVKTYWGSNKMVKSLKN